MHGTSEHVTLPGRGAAVDEVLLQNPLHGVESRSAADVQLVSLDKVAADEPVLERPRFPRLKFGILDEAVLLILDAPDEILELLALVPEQAAGFGELLDPTATPLAGIHEPHEPLVIAAKPGVLIAQSLDLLQRAPEALLHAVHPLRPRVAHGAVEDALANLGAHLRLPPLLLDVEPPSIKRRVARALVPSRKHDPGLAQQAQVVLPLGERPGLRALDDLHQASLLVQLLALPGVKGSSHSRLGHARHGALELPALLVELRYVLTPPAKCPGLLPVHGAANHLSRLVALGAAHLAELVKGIPRSADALVHDLPQASLHQPLEELLAHPRGVCRHLKLAPDVLGVLAPRAKGPPSAPAEDHRPRGFVKVRGSMRLVVQLGPLGERLVQPASLHLVHRAGQDVALVVEVVLHQEPAAPRLEHDALLHLVDAALEQVAAQVDRVLHFFAHARERGEVLERELHRQVLHPVRSPVGTRGPVHGVIPHLVGESVVLRLAVHLGAPGLAAPPVAARADGLVVAVADEPVRVPRRLAQLVLAPAPGERVVVRVGFRFGGVLGIGSLGGPAALGRFALPTLG